MSQISVNHLTFYYEGSYDNIFEDVSFRIDTDWKLGFMQEREESSAPPLKNVDFYTIPISFFAHFFGNLCNSGINSSVFDENLS